jgi:hypothetical protein
VSNLLLFTKHSRKGEIKNTAQKITSKGKVVHVQLNTMAEVWIHIFFILPLDGSEWSVSSPSWFTPGKEPLLPTRHEVGQASEPVCTICPSQELNYSSATQPILHQNGNYSRRNDMRD